MKTQEMYKIFTLSAWSFTLVISTLLFAFIGWYLDIMLGTPPMFMSGFLMLCFILSLFKLYKESKN